MTAAGVTHAVPDYEAKLYCATQTMDEARHVEVYTATSTSWRSSTRCRRG